MLRLVKDSTFHVWWTSSKQQILTFEKLKQRMCRIFSLFLLKSELNKCQNWSCDDWSINQLVIDDFYCRLITLSFVFKGIKDRICRLQLLKCEYFLVSLHYLGLLTVFWHFIDQTTHRLINEIINRLFDDENNHYSLALITTIGYFSQSTNQSLFQLQSAPRLFYFCSSTLS